MSIVAKLECDMKLEHFLAVL